jgi:hypothetical protein
MRGLYLGRHATPGNNASGRDRSADVAIGEHPSRQGVRHSFHYLAALLWHADALAYSMDSVEQVSVLLDTIFPDEARSICVGLRISRCQSVCDLIGIRPSVFPSEKSSASVVLSVLTREIFPFIAAGVSGVGGRLADQGHFAFRFTTHGIWMVQKLGAQNTLTIEGVAGFGLLLIFVLGLAEILDAIATSPTRRRAAAACVCPLVLWSVYSAALTTDTPEQVDAVTAILRLGGSVQREGTKSREIVAVQMEGQSFNDSHSRYLLVFPRVRRISFFNAAITDESIVRLKALNHVSPLGFQGTKITDRSLSHLATIPTLKYVWLSIGESISKEKIRHLQEIRPDLTVYY